MNFFEKLAGRWFSQRTTHVLSAQQSKAGKSDLEVAFLDPSADEVQQLCQQTSAKEPLCGLRVQQKSTVEGDTQPKQLTTLLVPCASASEHSPYEGKLIRSGQPGQSPLTGTYSLEDDVLTISLDQDNAKSTERMWFINDNLRMRTGMTELADGLRIASFCSEIRLGAKPPEDR